jgi:hypothetical protein
MQMWLCGECLEAKREPRFLIILVWRNFEALNPEKKKVLQDCVRNHKYYGDKITLKEVIP